MLHRPRPLAGTEERALLIKSLGALSNEDIMLALEAPGVLCVYGPFRFGGRHTSDSNAEFDRYLKARDPDSGIRDFAALDALAAAQGLSFAADHAMPANNRTLVWRRAAG